MTKRIGSFGWMARGAKRAAAALIALIAIVAMGSGAEAGFYNIYRVVGTSYPLIGDNFAYSVNLVTGSGSISLPIRIDCEKVGSGTKIAIAASKVSENPSSGTCTITPESVQIDDKGQATSTISFSDVSNDDVYRIVATLQDDSSQEVATSGKPSIVVKFASPSPVTAVSIDKGPSYSVRLESTSITKVFLTAAANSDATNVQYTWESSNPQVIGISPNNNTCDLSITAGTAPGASSTITVTAKGHNGSTASAQCVVTVRDNKDLAGDMAIPPTGMSGEYSPGDNQNAGFPILYGVDDKYIEETYSGLTKDAIITNAGILSDAESGTHNGIVVLASEITSAGSDKIAFDRRRQPIASTIGLEDKDTGRLVSAMTISADVMNYKNSGQVALVPMRVSFSFPSTFLNGDSLSPDPSNNEATVQSSYRVMKYAKNSEGKLSATQAESLSSKVGGAFIEKWDSLTNSFIFKPLVVLVDSSAPSGVATIPGTLAGSKYDSARNVLYIYDGKWDGRIDDPIVLERNPQTSSGGGGGGCSAGLGLAALAALSALFIRTRKR